MAPGARSKFGATMFEREFFRKQMTALKKVLVTFLRLSAPPQSLDTTRSASAPP